MVFSAELSNLPTKLGKSFMDNKFYTYAYLRVDGTPYYIGKGQGNRCYGKGGRNCNTPKDKLRILILKKNLTEEEAFKHEIYMIAVYGKKCDGTGILMNIADGGNAPPIISGNQHHMKTEEYKKRVGDKLRGRPKGKPAWNKGEKMNEAYKERITGKRNGMSKCWEITFEDGRQITLCGIVSWCKDNGYCKGCLSKMALGKEGRKKHKDIVKVVKVRETDP